MRVYSITDDFHNDILRDVLKRGVLVLASRYQDKDVEGDANFDSKELMNYSFVVTCPTSNALEARPGVHTLWCEMEFQERVATGEINPGQAWKRRSSVWKEFLLPNGRFSYTYNERIRTQLRKVIQLLQKSPETRQAIISIYNPVIDNEKLGLQRVPCSMYYQFLRREGALHLIYNMRSCDLSTHYMNDICLAVMMLEYVADCVGVKVGNLHVNIGSLHLFRKNWPDGMYLKEGDEDAS